MLRLLLFFDGVILFDAATIAILYNDFYAGLKILVALLSVVYTGVKLHYLIKNKGLKK